MARTSSLKIAKAQRGSVGVVQLAGVIDENFEAARLAEGLKGSVVIDLDGIQRITSFGVREWTRAMSSLGVTYLGFVRVRPTMVQQFNMISGFGNPGELISLYAPYVCIHCGEQTDVLIDVRKQIAELQRSEPPTYPCPKCKGETELDEIAETYFGYVASMPRPAPPPEVRALLDGTEEAKKQTLRVEKEVDGSVTAFWMYGPLDTGRALKRLGDGLQGDVVVVFSGVSSMELDGIAGLRVFSSTPDIDLQYTSVPALLATALIGACERARIVSVVLPFACRPCGQNMLRDIKADVLKAWFHSRVFDEWCVGCGGRLDPSLPIEHLDALRALPLGRESIGVRSYLMQHPNGPSQMRPISSSSRASKPATRDQSVPGTEMFGEYRIIQRLGVGGMGEVLLTRKVGPGGFEKKVVIKRILPQFATDAPRIEMFLSEAKIAARINHPNIVQIYDLGEIDGQFFIAMEYVKGWDIAKIGTRLRELGEQWPVDLAVWVCAEICAALRAAQEHVDESGELKPIVHRDVSPENVFISFDGSVKLGDFGVAKIADNPSHTQPGSLKGKLGYVAPERLVDDRRPIDGRVDIYAAGVVLHECCSGARLFLRDEPGRTLFAIMEHKVPRLADLRRDVPPELDMVVARAVAKDPEKRYQSAADMRDDLDRLLARIGRPNPPSLLSAWLKKIFEGAATMSSEISLSDLGIPRTAVTEIQSSQPDATIPMAAIERED